MKNMMLIAIFTVVSGCSSFGPESETTPMTRADVAGRYGQSGPVGFLELEASGAYECFIMNGITIDGCGTFEGAGVSEGSWALENGSITFEPMNEPADLIVKLAEVSAMPTEDGLVLTINGEDYFLVKKFIGTEQP